MKKHGFTLAEVLITLAIIGVVATLTLPSLISNTAEQQAVTAYRKAINTLNEAGQMNVAVDGFDYSQLSNGGSGVGSDTQDALGNAETSLWGILANRAQIDVAASEAGGIPGRCDGLDQIFFRDGTVLCYTPNQTAGNDDTTEGWIDTNGRKGPNMASTCQDEGCPKETRNINDQFPVTLNGTNAIPGHVEFTGGQITEDNSPEGNAAAWAMRK